MLCVLPPLIDAVTPWMDRLASMLKKRTLSPQKLDEVKLKANVLSAFKAVEEKAEEIVEEVEEKVEEVVGRATAEL